MMPTLTYTKRDVDRYVETLINIATHTATSINISRVGMIDRDIMRRWADATRHHRWDEAEQLWQQLMAQWLTPPAVDQDYWNRLLRRRMAVLERREQRSTVNDDEWDRTHGDINQ